MAPPVGPGRGPLSGAEETVSVVVCTYNRASELRRAVESILSQRRAADQVIVVDDGSTDDTQRVLRTFGTAIEVLCQPNQGASSARNAGVAAAHGTWVAFLDSDDVWLDHHLGDLLDVVRECPDLVWAFSTRFVQLEPGAPPTEEATAAALDSASDAAERRWDYLQITGAGLPSATSTFMVRRSILEELGGFDTAFRAGEDLDLWWRIACTHPSVGVARSPSVCMECRRGDSLSTNASRDASGTSDLVFARNIARNLERMEAAGRGGAFEAVAGLHLDAVVERAVARRDLEVLREVGWDAGRLLSRRGRLLLRWCLATGRPGAELLGFLRALRLQLRPQPGAPLG
jgi:glycosyltransferase involved in cell wall biosynthesis